MIVNFLNDEDLERWFPDLLSYRQGGQNDYSGPLRLGLEFVLDDIVARDLKPRLCMIPLDLNRTSSKIQQLTSLGSSALTLPYYSKMYQGTNQRRAFLSIVNKQAGDRWQWTLRGSNAPSPTDASDSTCEDILSFLYMEDDKDSSKNQTFTYEYKWYGFKLERLAGSGDINFTAGIYETSFDFLIAFKALEIVSAQWETGLNEKWGERKDDMKKQYDERLEMIRINYDSNEDGVATQLETGKKLGSSIGTISIVS